MHKYIKAILKNEHKQEEFTISIIKAHYEEQ